MGTHAGGNVGVERLRLSTIAEVEHLFAGARFHVGGRARAGPEEAGGKQADEARGPHGGKVIHRAPLGKQLIVRGRVVAEGPVLGVSPAFHPCPTRGGCGGRLSPQNSPPSEMRVVV